MTRVGVLGASGRMGRLVVQEILASSQMQLAAAVDAPGSSALGTAVGDIAVTALRKGAFDSCEVVIDFSTPAALLGALPHLGDAALVTGTTGLTTQEQDNVEKACLKRAWLQAANFSLGVNLLLDLVKQAAGALRDYDLEIIEAHHRHKVDAPSGTALALGHAAANGRGVSLDTVATHGREGHTGPRRAGTMGFHALRGGDVAGDHTVWIAGEGERVELRHVATSRITFARGALRASEWLVSQRPGRYTMADVLELT
jgi:4-hydroxy-tetrahydrodipicolinate reductase